jgi:hypothetical protein
MWIKFGKKVYVDTNGVIISVSDRIRIRIGLEHGSGFISEADPHPEGKKRPQIKGKTIPYDS